MQVAFALLLSIFIALIVKGFGWENSAFADCVNTFGTFVGNLFMRMLSMIVVPLVVTSVVCGSMSLGKGRQFVRVGVKTLLFYLGTGFLAVLLSIFLVNIIQPGCVSFELANNILGANVGVAPTVNAKVEDITGILLRFFPPNIIEAASDNTQLLGLIVFAIIIGIFINTLPEKYSDFQRKFWTSFNVLFEKITNMIMRFLPLGVFGLTAPVCLRAGVDVVGPVVMFFIPVVLALGLHSLGTMSLVL